MLRCCANLSLLFTEVPLLQRFSKAKAHGFNAVEIQFPYTESVQSIHAALSENQLELVLFNVDADDLLQGGEGLAAVPEKKALFRDALEQCVHYAEHLKPQVINVLPGRCLDTLRCNDYLATLMDNLRYAVKRIAPLGIKTAFEAVNNIDMPGFLIHNHRHMLKILQRIKHPDLYIQYDIYHMVMMGEDPALFIKRHAQRIAHIQFADVPGRNQPGTGNIDFPQLFRQIKQSHYQGWLGAEYKPRGASADSLAWFLPFMQQ